MKPDIAKKWVAALRSGEYKQGRGALRVEDHFCCLGVLCDIVKDDVGGQWQPCNELAGQITSAFIVGDLSEIDDALPEPVREFVGMKTGLGGFNLASGHLITLARENDNGRSFEKIADIIENNVEKL